MESCSHKLLVVAQTHLSKSQLVPSSSCDLKFKVDLTARAEADIDKAYRYSRDHDGPGELPHGEKGCTQSLRNCGFPVALATLLRIAAVAARLPLPPEDLG